MYRGQPNKPWYPPGEVPDSVFDSDKQGIDGRVSSSSNRSVSLESNSSSNPSENIVPDVKAAFLYKLPDSDRWRVSANFENKKAWFFSNKGTA